MPTTEPTSRISRPGGHHLALRDWPLPAGERRATALLVHGLGEHGGRYPALAGQLNGWGLAVRCHDHFGHGQSSGVRGALPADDRLLADLAAAVDDTRARLSPGEPLVLFGHSMGGLVAATFVARALRPVDALVLSSPALAIFTNPLQKLLLATLPRWLPNLRVGNGLDPRHLSHDAAVVAAYRSDPLCHDRISTRLAHFIATTGADTLAHAPRWSTPTLLLWGSDDRLVDPAGCRAFAASAPPALVSAREFPGLYHELFNEADPAPVFAALHQWLDTAIGPAGRAPAS